MKALVRLSAMLTFTAVLLVGTTAPALADGPETWDPGASRSTLENLVFFGGGTLALIVVITLFAVLTARTNYVPPPPSSELEVSDDHH